ncbi:MAG TPA: hypothetical protein VIK86_07500 [Candidatus Paceibacterota bacterium]
MLYTVEEASVKLKVSRQTVYTKIKLTKFKNKLVISQGKSMLTEELVNLIESDLNVKKDLNISDTSYKEEKALKLDKPILEDDIVKINEKLVNSLIEQLADAKLQMKEKDLQLNLQLAAKDLQIHEMNERLKNEQELNRNNQELLINPKQDIKLLEEHFQDLDSKFTEIRQDMNERKDPPKGLLKRMFKK